MCERQLRKFIDFIGPDILLEGVSTDAIQRFDVHLSGLPGLRGQTLSAQSRRHYLNSVSNLYRRAQSEGYVPPGYNPVAAMVDKPTGRRLEARWLEVHDAALFLEAARRYQGKRADLAVPFVHDVIAALLLTGGRWREVAGLLVSDVSFDRDTVTFRPHEHQRLKTLTSFRTVPLHPQLREILETYLRSYQRIGGLLFHSPRTGKMITDLRKQLDGIAESVGWGAGDIRTTIFRHTYCAARLQTLDEGHPIAIYTVARELGHGGDSLVKRVYGHLGRVGHRAQHVEFRIEQARGSRRGPRPATGTRHGRMRTSKGRSAEMTEHIHTSQVVEPGDQSIDMGGLELRDWLAGQALVGLTVHAGGRVPYVVAEEAYKLADEMLKARREAAT